MDLFPLSRKVCAVFGATGGIGRAVCQTLARQGGVIAVVGRNQKRTSETLDFLAKTSPDLDGVGHAGFCCDITDIACVQDTVARVLSTIGEIDILVNAAGINRDSLLLRTKDSDMQDVISTNLLGSIYTCRAVIKTMVKRRHGCIVNIGSVVGDKGNAGQAIYSASKSDSCCGWRSSNGDVTISVSDNPGTQTAASSKRTMQEQNTKIIPCLS